MNSKSRPDFSFRKKETRPWNGVNSIRGPGKGTLYRRFAHKGQLCQALIDANTRALQDEVLAEFGEEGRKATTHGRLRLFLQQLLVFTEENATFLKALTNY